MFGLNKYLIGGVLVVIAAMGVTIKYYMGKSDSYYAASIKNEMAYKQTLESAQAYAGLIVERDAENQNLVKAFEKIEDKTDEAKAVLKRHDLAKLVKDNPAALERVINDGIARVYKEFDDIFNEDTVATDTSVDDAKEAKSTSR